MPSNFTTYHCTSLKDQLTLEVALGVSDQHRIPLSKILHTLGRKGYLQTVIWERNVDNPEYAAEIAVYTGADKSLKADRLHFISAQIDNINELKQHPQAYGGYCDIRPGTRSVIVAYITQNAAVRLDNETYAFLCCSMPRDVEVRNEIGELVLSPQIITFPCMEKDYKGVMCSQAALLPLFEYWNFIRSDMFSVTDVMDLNRKCGVSDTEVQHERGLTLLEVRDFLNAEKAAHLILNYDQKTAGAVNPLESVQDIYGFVESGFPVVAVVTWPYIDNAGNEKKAVHALLCLGHTYDRNSWMAMADIGYFGRSGVGGQRYHSNTTWIKHFIVHDDNFGPYYFLPTSEIEKMIVAAVVVLPQDSIATRPSEIAEAVFEMLIASEKFLRDLARGISDPVLLEQNKQWLNHFLDHLKVQCGDGLVLRPILLSRNAVLGRYRKHEFRAPLEALLEGKDGQYFWYVELTWPDIYCHRQLCCGSVILDPKDKRPIFVHTPGICIAFQDGDAIPIIAKEEDQPRKHYKED